MKTLILSFSALLCLQALSQTPQQIEMRKVSHSTTTNYTDGTSHTTSPGYSLQWRYLGEENWKNTGRRYKTISPVLNQFECSAQLLRETKNLDLYGKGSGWLIMSGGFAMTLIGFSTTKEVESVDPLNGETIITQKRRKTLAYAGIATIFAGYYVRWGSIQLSMKRFGQACDEYNNMVSKDTGNVGHLDFGLQGSNLSTYPLMNVKLSF